jgi:hypothetical protein
MKRITKIIFCLILALCLAQLGSAYTVKSMTITPTSDYTAGQKTSADGVITFSGGSETFPTTNSLKFVTDLESASWKFELVLDTITIQEIKKGGKIVSLDGFVLSYPSDSTFQLKVFMEGVVPNTTESSFTIIKIQQLDSTLNLVTNGEYKKDGTIFNPTALAGILQQRKDALSALRVNIDQKIRSGVDVSASEAKYTDAKNAISRAETALAGGTSAGYKTAQTELNSANTLISDGNTLLEQAFAEHEIGSAEQKIQDVDALITYFTVNRSMGNDARVSTIIGKRDIAAQTLSQAKNKFTEKNYPQAQILANETGLKAQEAYTLAVDLKNQVGEGFSFGGIYLYLGIFVLAIMAIGGFVLYKKRFKWDELG